MARWEQRGVIFSYRVEDLSCLWAKQGEVDVRLIWKGSDASNRQPYALCPSCGWAAALIVIRGHEWRCSVCHALPTRSRQLSADVRATENLVRLTNPVRAAEWRGLDAAGACGFAGEALRRADHGEPALCRANHRRMGVASSQAEWCAVRLIGGQLFAQHDLGAALEGTFDKIARDTCFDTILTRDRPTKLVLRRAVTAATDRIVPVTLRSAETSELVETGLPATWRRHAQLPSSDCRSCSRAPWSRRTRCARLSAS